MEFLKKPSNSLIKEEILNYGLFFDLKIAAATKNQQLKIYRPEVDMEGFDIILEDATDFSRKIQIKSRVNSTTNRWNDIHRNILLPAMSQSEDYGFDTIVCPFTPGGFLLIDIVKTQDNIKSPIQLEYYYTDINIISLLALGYITGKNNSKKKAIDVLRKLQISLFVQKTITITQNLLIKLKDADALLKICGLLGQVDFIFNTWKLNQLFYRKSIYFEALFEPYNNEKDYLSWFEEQEKNAERGHKLRIEEIFKEIQF